MIEAIAFARRFGPYIVAGALILGLAAALLITRGTLADRTTERDQARQALSDQIADYRAAAKEAQTKAAAVDAHNAAVQKESQNAIEAQLADARTRAADYARRLSNTLAQARSGSGGGSMPQAAVAAGEADGAGTDAVLADDLAICSENTVKAQGWQDWWGKVSVER